MYGVYTVFLAGKSPNIRSYTVHIYRSGQPYIYGSGQPLSSSILSDGASVSMELPLSSSILTEAPSVTELKTRSETVACHPCHEHK